MAKAAKKTAAKKKVAGAKRTGAKKVVTRKKDQVQGDQPEAQEQETKGGNGKVIRIKVKDSPYKEGTRAREHFDAMKGGVTVAQYLDKFENRKNASQWLGNMVRAQHVELLG